jgi:hypothetical protein
MARTFDREPAPGGGGGIDRPLRPVANDDEDPEPDIRVMHLLIYGEAGQDKYLGIPPARLAAAIRRTKPDSDTSHLN